VSLRLEIERPSLVRYILFYNLPIKLSTREEKSPLRHAIIQKGMEVDLGAERKEDMITSQGGSVDA